MATMFSRKTLRRYLIASTDTLIKTLEESHDLYQMSVSDVVAWKYEHYEHLSLAYAMRRWLSRDYEKTMVTAGALQAGSILAVRMYEADDILSTLPSIEAYKNIAFSAVYDEVSTPQILGECRANVKAWIKQDKTAGLRQKLRIFGRSFNYETEVPSQTLVHTPCSLRVEISPYTQTQWKVQLVDEFMSANDESRVIASAILSMSKVSDNQYMVSGPFFEVQQVKHRTSSSDDSGLNAKTRQGLKISLLMYAAIRLTRKPSLVFTLPSYERTNERVQYVIGPIVPDADDVAYVTLIRSQAGYPNSGVWYQMSNNDLLNDIKNFYISGYVVPQITLTAFIKE